MNVKAIRPNLLAIIILGFLGIVIYSNTFNNSFHFDDLSFILHNPKITTLERLTDLFRYWPSRFIGFFSFAVNYQIHQFSVFGYHLVNIGLHILTSFLVFWFVCLTFSTPVMKEKEAFRYKEFIGFFAAAIFLTHPVQTETLNYIFQRVTILAAFFYLTSLCLYVKAMLSLEKSSRINKFYYFSSLMLAFIGMFTKENVVTLPLMILLYDFYFFRKGKNLTLKYAFPFLLLLPLVPLTVGIAKPIIFADVERLLSNPLLTPAHYLWTQLNVLVTYLRLFLFPVGQNLDYDYPVAQTFWGTSTLASFSTLVFILIMGILMFSRHRLMSFGIFWFFLTLLPESSIIPILDPIYEHRLYLPLVGCSIFGIDAVYYFFRNKKFKIVIVILSTIVFFCSIFTYKRNRVWKNELFLWSDVVNKSPKKVRPYNNRGLAYFDQGEYDKAIIDFTQAIGLNGDYADGYYNRGLVYQKKGEYGKAVFDYTKAVIINPKYLKAYINRGQVYSANKEYEKAIFDFRRAIEIAPLDTQAYFNLAYLYLTLGNRKEAIAFYNKILEIDPNDATAYYNLGVIYADIGDKKEAIALLKKAMEADPQYAAAFDKLNSAEAYAGLGSSYCLLGKNKMAVFFLKKAVELNPKLGVAHNNLAVAYYYNKDYDLAIQHCDKAIKLGHAVSPEFLEFLKPHRKSLPGGARK